MDELDFSWADLGNTFGGAVNTVLDGWAEGTAAKLRGDDGQRPLNTTADNYDQRVQVPNDGTGQTVADRISGALGGMNVWVVAALGLGLAAAIYSSR